MKSEEFAYLEEDIKEQKRFIKEGIQRIKKYYTLPPDKRETETGLSRPPHEILLKRSAKIIRSGLGNSFENNGTGQTDLQKLGFKGTWIFDYILIGVGTEILLKSIILKEDHEFFIKKIEPNHTINFYDCIKKLPDFLSDISPKHRKRIKDVLELIHLKRNNLVHLGFHQESSYREEFLVADILRFLFLYFFKENSSEIVEKLDKVKKETVVTSGIDYEPLDFDKYV